VRVERELARRARHHLGDDLTFCVYDRSRNLVLAVDDATAQGIISGEVQIDFTSHLAPPTRESIPALRRMLLANATIYHTIQRLRGRSFTRAQILDIQARELGRVSSSAASRAMSLSLAQAAPNAAPLDAETLAVSGGLDWQYKDVRGLRALKQRHKFRYCTVIHDLIPLIFPQFVTAGYDTLVADYFAEMSHLADYAICDSQATRRDWLAFCGERGVSVPSFVFSLGSDLPRAETGSALPPALQGKRFALFVSTIEPRKNHRVLYEAWDRCIRSRSIDPERDRLVFVGRQGWATDDLMRELAANPATRDTILVLNHVSDALLETLYRACALVLFPSFYEGYGLPVAEALGHAKPCISSNGGSLAEIGGDLVQRLDPKDTIGWAKAIAHYLDAPDELAAWTARIKANYRRVTWNDAADEFFGRIKGIAS
jgi:glycosyltransferase involved in cell wall biosynthesis